MPWVGLINKRGERVRFEDIPRTFHRDDWGMPLPALMVLMRQKTIYQQFLRAFNTMNPGNKLRLAPSVTQLLKPPRVAALDSIYDYYEEPDGLIKRELGTMGHAAIEENVRALRDGGNDRYAAEVMCLFELIPGVFVPMCIDLVDKVERNIEDHKFTSAYKMKLGRDPLNWEIGGKLDDWTRQTNLYALACSAGAYAMLADADGRPNGATKFFQMPVESIYLNVWQGDDRDEPRSESFSVPMLPMDLTREHFAELYHRHMAAQDLVAAFRRGQISEAALHERLEPCSERDQWRKAPAFAVWKQGNQKATKTFYGDKHNSEAEARKAAQDYADEMNAKSGGYYVEERKGFATRCADWCPVAGVCAQARAENAGTETWQKATDRWRQCGGGVTQAKEKAA